MQKPTENQGLREDILRYMKEHNVSMSATARGITISPAALSTWMSGTYKGDNDNIEKLVRNFLEKELEKQSEKMTEIPFVMTSVAGIIFRVARTCHLHGKMGMIYGASGLGKTFAAVEYTAKHSDTIYIHANRSFTPKVLFRKLSRELGYSGKGYVAELLDEIIEKLKGSGRLIIVDQANFLNVTSLHLLRTIYDEAKVGVLLLGTEDLYWNIRGQKEEYAQVYTRIAVPVKLGKWKPEDAEKVVKAVLPESEDLYREFYSQSGGNGKVLENVIFNSVKFAEVNGGKMSAEAIRTAGSMVIK